MTTLEMKLILAKKLKDEGTYFTAKDIKFRKVGDTITIVIAGYEHVPFRINKMDGDLFIWEDEEIIGMAPDTDDGYKEAMIEIGYNIGTTF